MKMTVLILLHPENGGGILVASSDEWKYTNDGQEFQAQISYGLGKRSSLWIQRWTLCNL
jgi:hypothetical protein